MVKFFKRAWLLCLALCLTLGICVAATACDSTPTQINYKVTVSCEQEDLGLLSLVKVQLLDKDGKAAASEKSLENGSATFTLDEGEYTVKLSGIDADKYTYPETKLTKSNSAATVKISRKSTTPDNSNKIEYRIKVLYPNGNPVKDASVQLCLASGFCVNPKDTGADGISSFSLDPDEYQIHILPNTDTDDDAENDAYFFDDIEYTFDNDEYLTTAEGGEYIVRLKAVA